MPEVYETAPAEPAPEPVNKHRPKYSHEDSEMSGINESLDKININMPGADGAGGGGGLAAALAALAGGAMGRDQGNNLWPLLLLLRGRGGFGDGDRDGGECGEAGRVAFNQSILNGIVGLTSAVPTTALETQNAIAAQSLGIQQGFSSVKDSVQNSSALLLNQITSLNTSVLTSALQTNIAIGNDGDKTRALIQSINDANLNRELTVAQNALAEERGNRRSRDVEVNVTQQVNQQQQQLQFQAQLGNLAACMQALMVQNNRTNQDIVNLGTMTASGTQATTNTQVR